MNRLIQVRPVSINAKQILRTVDGKDLHKLLGVKAHYDQWIMDLFFKINLKPFVNFVLTFASHDSSRRALTVIFNLSLDVASEIVLREQSGEWKALCEFFSNLEREIEEEYFGASASGDTEALAAAA